MTSPSPVPSILPSPDSAPSEPPPGVRPSRILAACAFVALATAALCFTPLRASHDEWWHLKTGRWIEEHGLPENEIFTYTAADIPWHNHEWLSQLALWKIYRFGSVNLGGGVRAVIGFKTLWLVATYAGLAWWLARRTGSAAAGGVAALLAADLARRTLYPRPPFLSYGLMALTLAVCLELRAGRMRRAWLVALPPFFALWANLHGGFMAGLVVVAAFAGESVVGAALAWWRREDFASARTGAVAHVAALVACFLATLLNPSGFGIYLLVPRVMNSPVLPRIISELLPPDWRFVHVFDGAVVLAILSTLRPEGRRAWARAGALAAGYLVVVRLLHRLALLRLGDPTMAEAASEFLQQTARTMLACGVFALMCARSREGAGLAPGLLVVFFAWQSVRHVRHLPLLGIALAPPLAVSLADWIDRPASAWNRSWNLGRPRAVTTEAVARDLRDRRRRGEAAGFALLALLTAFHLFWPIDAGYDVISKEWREQLPDRRTHAGLVAMLADGTETMPGAYPIAAVDALLAQRPPGRLFNGGNYAGYLIWRLSPERYKVFTDNRYDIYGDLFVGDQQTVLEALPPDPAHDIDGWRETLDRWFVNTLLIPEDAPIHRVLMESRGYGGAWRLIHADGRFAIWTRANPLPVADRGGSESATPVSG